MRILEAAICLWIYATKKYPTSTRVQNNTHPTKWGARLGGGDSPLERETGFEPATFGLGSRRSTAELLPQSGTILTQSLLKIKYEPHKNPINLIVYFWNYILVFFKIASNNK